ncbi:MAG: hypothetical protein JWM97_2818 [Phycisphaerales bacterium]|nr:hypothetical protein [Phycisphaerales bacterium]
MGNDPQQIRIPNARRSGKSEFRIPETRMTKSECTSRATGENERRGAEAQRRRGRREESKCVPWHGRPARVLRPWPRAHGRAAHATNRGYATRHDSCQHSSVRFPLRLCASAFNSLRISSFGFQGFGIRIFRALCTPPFSPCSAAPAPWVVIPAFLMLPRVLSAPLPRAGSACGAAQVCAVGVPNNKGVTVGPSRGRTVRPNGFGRP